MKITITQRCETSTGKHVFRFEEGESIDTAMSTKLSVHPDAARRLKLKDAEFDQAAQRLVDLGMAEETA